MSSFRLSSILVGIIFIVATVSALLAAFIEPILAGSTFLSAIGANKNQVVIGIVFYIVAAMTSASIPIVMYPIIKRKHPVLALGSVVFRAIEAVFYLVAVLSLLSLVTIGQRITAVTGDQQSLLYVIGNFLLKLREQATLLGVVSFCIGSMMYYVIFIKSRITPLWISIWGIAAVILMLVACGLSLLSDNPITGYAFLVLPIALQEMAMAVWLIAKGFPEE